MSLCEEIMVKDENNVQERNLGEDVEEVKIFLTD